MSLERLARITVSVPSITSWTRLEPLPREGSLQRSLQAQVRDPLWLLARQWQVGEFQGADAGSPVQATLGIETRNLTTYRPGADDSATVPLSQGLPVEVHVEREPVTMQLRGAARLGLYFEGLIRAGGVASPDAVIAAFRAAFPIAPNPPDPDFQAIDAVRYRALAAGRVVDGEALYHSAAAAAAGQTPAVPLPPEANDPGVAGVLAAYVTYRQSLFSEPAHDSAWQAGRLEYEFALGSPVPGDNLLLSADDFPGGYVDWYSFTLEQAQASPAGQANPAQITPLTFNFLPNHITFRGMPDPRWWNFEDGVTDFGQLDTEHVDLAKMLVMEFALIYGNDWFVVPVPTDIGSLIRVTTLVVTDTFGQRTLVRPSEQTQVNPGESPWSMYKISSVGRRSDFVAMAPTLGVVDNGADLEDVLFLRDDMAAMAWAVEHKLQGELDAPVDAYELYLQRLKNDPLPPPPAAVPGGPEIYYTLETTVPDNWIPLVPVKTQAGALYLRRGTMTVPTGHGFVDLKARALVLQPGAPFFLDDRAVPPSGRETRRYCRRTRSPDGSTFIWMARQTRQGRGPGWSGLRFDFVRPLTGAPFSG